MKVLLATDLSETSLTARSLLSNLTWRKGCEVEVLHVVETIATPGARGAPSDHEVSAKNEGTVRFARTLGSRLAAWELPVRGSLRLGDPATTIVQYAAEMRADLVVVGGRARGHLTGGMRTGVSSAVVERAHCSVLVARSETIRSVLVADDGSHRVNAAIMAVVSGSLFDSVHVTVVRVVDLRVPLGKLLFQERSAYVHQEQVQASRRRQAAGEVERRVAALRAVGRMAHGRVVCGEAATEILNIARSLGTDLIVIGAGAPDQRPIDDVARSVLFGSRGSILIARVPCARHAAPSHLC